jgi:hypothetical protein
MPSIPLIFGILIPIPVKFLGMELEFLWNPRYWN